MERLGVYGGTFDPVHRGHLAVARSVRKSFDLDRVLFIPARQSPLRGPPLASPNDRLAMVCRAIEDEPEVLRTYSRQARQPFNVTGHPALAVPAGFSSDGMPLSFQIAGRNFDEAAIYRAARAYERATGWPDRHPEL